MLNVWEIFNQTKTEITKHMQKGKQKFVFQLKLSRFQTYFTKSKSFIKNVIGFNNHTQRYTVPNYLGVDIPL